MHLLEFKKQNKLKVGAKQAFRAISEGKAETLYVAKDSEEHVVKNVLDAAKAKDVEIVYVDSMKELGKACGIDVGAAAAVVLK